jgi:hypothetical protein
MNDKIDVIRNDIDVMRATAAAGGWERQKRDAAWEMELDSELDSRIAQSVKRMESRVTKRMEDTREMAGWVLFSILIVAIAIGNPI